jgi:serine/threonine protein kinase
MPIHGGGRGEPIMQGQHEAGRSNEQVRLIADRFEKAWQAGGVPELTDFLPPPGDSQYLSCLQGLVKVDLEFRWSSHRGAALEHYLQRFPALKESLDPELIYAEYQARHLYGDKPTLDSYVRRFPGQHQALQRLIFARPIGAIVPRTTAPGETAPEQQQPETFIFKPGTELPFGGGFRLIKRLGSGSFAEVWQATASGGFSVAVKKLHHSLEMEEAQRELQSLESIKELKHPYLLQTQASFLYGNYLFVVMELAAGSLAELLKKNPNGLPIAELLRYVKEAAEALDYMHSQNVHHRDIKPANLLYLQGHVKVADFGLARVMERSTNASLAGTYAYMAPEVVQKRASLHSDQYSLAMTYAHLRLGRHPLPLNDVYALFRNIGKPVPLEPLPTAEQAVLHRALDSDPSKRHQSCSAFAQALEEAVAPPVGAAVTVPSRQMVLVFTDLVGSVALKNKLGHSAYSKILVDHDGIFRKLVAGTPGAEIMKDTGDGFLARFSSSSSAVAACLCFQYELRAHDWGGEPVQARVGIHVGEVEELGKGSVGPPKLAGRAADMAARVMNLAAPRQILMTRSVYDDARMYVREHPSVGTGGLALKLECRSHGKYLFKGSDEPIEVYEIGAVGVAPFTAPPDSDKARRILPEKEPLAPRSPWPGRLQNALLVLLLAAVAVVLALWWWRPTGFELERPADEFMAAGSVKNMTLGVKRFVSARPDKPIELTFDNLPQGVLTDPAVLTIPAELSKTDVKLLVKPDAPTGDYRIDIHARSEDVTREGTLLLKIEERAYYLPPGWKPAEGARRWEAAEGAKPAEEMGAYYYDKVDVIKGGERVRFLFIPADVSHALPSPFYIMEDKVWFGLFSVFANDASKPKPLSNSEWQEKKFDNGDPQLPVMRVVALDAHAFAQWLGGAKCLLPTTDQWDKAAGRFDQQKGRKGPFEGSWPPVTDQIAVRRTAPLERGKAVRDKSPYYVLDMSGNGKEWTRTGEDLAGFRPRQVDFNGLLVKKNGTEPIYLFLRGRDYKEERPFYFDDLNDRRERPGVERVDAPPHPSIGFRVVIEP